MSDLLGDSKPPAPCAMTSKEAQSSTATLDGTTNVTYLRSQPARVVGNTGEDTIGVCIRAQHATEVEISDLHPPVLVNQQVWRLQIPVQNWRVVVVQL